MKWLLKKYMVEAHIDSMAELARQIGMTRRALYDRISEPQTFRVFEIAALDEILHFTDEDLTRLIRGQV